MVSHITNVIKWYQDKLRELPYVPKTSYRRDSRGYCGDANKTSLTFLFSEKIGGTKKTVHIEESKFGRRKCRRGHSVHGQWVFGGVQPDSGATFLVPALVRTADTLTTVISAWIEPGTTLISDCWAAHRDVESGGYTHRTVNHSTFFVNPDTGNHTNTIACSWRHVKAFLGPYHRQQHYEFHLVHYMFAARCKAQWMPQFGQLPPIGASTD
jgi:hypothetical protein